MSFYRRKLPTGNFSATATARNRFSRTFSLTEKQIENKFSIWSLLFLPITDWVKLPAATEQSSFRTPKNAPDDRDFRTLRSASKGFALLKPTTFSKRWTKTFVCFRRFGFRANKKSPSSGQYSVGKQGQELSPVVPPKLVLLNPL